MDWQASELAELLHLTVSSLPSSWKNWQKDMKEIIFWVWPWWKLPSATNWWPKRTMQSFYGPQLRTLLTSRWAGLCLKPVHHCLHATDNKDRGRWYSWCQLYGAISKLQAFDLIREDGKKKWLAFNLYMTTDYFLDYMGINDLAGITRGFRVGSGGWRVELFVKKCRRSLIKETRLWNREGTTGKACIPKEKWESINKTPMLVASQRKNWRVNQARPGHHQWPGGSGAGYHSQIRWQGGGGGQPIYNEEKVYYLLNRPRGVTSSLTIRGRKKPQWTCFLQVKSGLSRRPSGLGHQVFFFWPMTETFLMRWSILEMKSTRSMQPVLRGLPTRSLASADTLRGLLMERKPSQQSDIFLGGPYQKSIGCTIDIHEGRNHQGQKMFWSSGITGEQAVADNLETWIWQTYVGEAVALRRKLVALLPWRCQKIMKRILILLVRLYQRFHFPLPPGCLIKPTCSAYMIQALEKHGMQGFPDGF